ncbi:hypothetical protein B5S32_g2557 [[Candida] boidinii]|nr:hypothetical protein B5S29_g2160 [[Candida] boidinii]OWB78364.1 hypothetical protein B5S32_g2557 [[Candida] boidinii]
MSDSTDDKTQIKVKFITRDEDETLQCSNNPLFVPISLKRYGLSEIVNHLIDTETPVPFDFLIDGTLLKTSIDEYLTKNGLSTETILTLEYTRAILPPSYLASFNNEDWISSIDTLPTMTSDGFLSNPKIISGSYDGIVRIYNMSGKVQTQLVGHQSAVKAVKFISPTRFVSGGNDNQLRLWKAKKIDDGESKPIDEEDDDDDENDENGEDKTQNAKTLAILEGHKSPISSLSVDLQSNRILSGGYDNTIGIWSTNHKEMQSSKLIDINSKNLSSSSRKRAKLALKDSTIKRKLPLSFLESHTGPIEGVIFDSNDNTVGYSCSQDHTVKTWDLVTNKCIDTKTTSYSLLSILQLEKLNLLICGSSARHINLIDPRINNFNEDKITQSQLIGHKNFVVSLDKSPDNDYVFISGSHDGTCKVWDIRANKSLYTITREVEDIKKDKTKVFSVRWESEIGIISGGSDKKLQINKGSDILKN